MHIVLALDKSDRSCPDPRLVGMLLALGRWSLAMQEILEAYIINASSTFGFQVNRPGNHLIEKNLQPQSQKYFTLLSAYIHF